VARTQKNCSRQLPLPSCNSPTKAKCLGQVCTTGSLKHRLPHVPVQASTFTNSQHHVVSWHEVTFINSVQGVAAHVPVQAPYEDQKHIIRSHATAEHARRAVVCKFIQHACQTLLQLFAGTAVRSLEACCLAWPAWRHLILRGNLQHQHHVGWANQVLPNIVLAIHDCCQDGSNRRGSTRQMCARRATKLYTANQMVCHVCVSPTLTGGTALPV
jgi:hypothetical protein